MQTGRTDRPVFIAAHDIAPKIAGDHQQYVLLARHHRANTTNHLQVYLLGTQSRAF